MYEETTGLPKLRSYMMSLIVLVHHRAHLLIKLSRLIGFLKHFLLWTRDLKFCVKSGSLHGLLSNLTNSIASKFLVSYCHCGNCATERLSSLKLNTVSLPSWKRSMRKSILSFLNLPWLDWLVGFGLIEIFSFNVFWWVDALICSGYEVGNRYVLSFYRYGAD